MNRLKTRSVIARPDQDFHGRTKLATLIELAVLITLGLAGAVSMAAAPATQPTGPQLGSPAFVASPEHPIGYRGDGTGCYPGATDPCLIWQEHGAAPAPDKNILWETTLNGSTQSYPIVVGNKVITLEEPDFVVCLDADSGKLLWRTECDQLTLFPPAEQERGRKLAQELQDTIFKVGELHFEAVWHTGQWLKDQPWIYPWCGPGRRKGTGSHEDPAAVQKEMDAIDKEWNDLGFDGSPENPMGAGHGYIPYKDRDDKYNDLARKLVDCRFDFGMCMDMFNITIQPQNHGQTQGTPISDGTNIFANFAYGQTACLDMDGKIKWMKWFPADTTTLNKTTLLAMYASSHWSGYMYSKLGISGPSPLLVGDKVIVTQGYAIRALDKATGALLWTVNYGNGIVEGRGSDRAPAAMTLADGTQVLICPQGFIIRVSDGKVMNKANPRVMFMVPYGSMHNYIMGVVAVGDMCYFTWGGGAGCVHVVKTGPNSAETLYRWVSSVPWMASLGCTGGTRGIPYGDYGSETFMLGAPLYDPVRKRVYIALHMSQALFSFDAETGALLDSVGMRGQLAKMPRDVVSPYLSGSGSNECTDPELVGNKYIYMPNDMGDCFVIDADDIHHVLAANNIMIQFDRDLMRWEKPWPEIKAQLYQHYLLCDSDLVVHNDAHRAPGDPFFVGNRVYIRTLEGMTCVSSEKMPGHD